MRTRPLAVAATLLLLGASALSAQRRIERIDAIEVMVAANTACGAEQENHIFVIVDASSSSDCDSTGGGSTNALCMCDGGSMKAVAGSASIADYVPITKAGQQSITATGAGNDVTLVAADDVLVTPADDFVVTPTAGSATLNAVGAGEDVSLVAADDIILTATDALTITAASGTLAATTTFAVDAAGGTDELGIAEGFVGIMGCNNYGPLADYSSIATPGECDVFFDTTLHASCEYNGTGWVKVADGSTACTSGA